VGRPFESVRRTALELNQDGRKQFVDVVDDGDGQGSGEKNRAACAACSAHAAGGLGGILSIARSAMLMRGSRGTIIVDIAVPRMLVVMHSGDRRTNSVVRWARGDLSRRRTTAVSRATKHHARSDGAPDGQGGHQQQQENQAERSTHRGKCNTGSGAC
jgi:hypothetical protein